MMASIPIISTNFRSIPEIVTHEHNGLLVAPSSAQEITEAIERLYFDRDLLLQLSLKNAAKSTQFSAEKLAAKIVKIATSK
jgi:glycosyltransferase involved in cell wall biosynthesis